MVNGFLVGCSEETMDALNNIQAESPVVGVDRPYSYSRHWHPILFGTTPAVVLSDLK